MPDIEFICPNCGQSLEASIDMHGQLIDCPMCGKAIEVSKPQYKSDTTPIPKISTVKACPYCSEEILITARKCKHCGEYLDESLKTQRQSKESDPDGKIVVKPRGEGCFLQTLNIGCVIIVFLVVAFIIYVASLF